MRRILIAAAVAGALLPAAAHGATTHPISVRSNSFDPHVLRAVGGDTARWTFEQSCYGGTCSSPTHNVTAFAGATFASGNLAYPATFSYTLPQTQTIRYRCTLHSSVTTAGACTGMCGYIGDADADFTPPTVSITAPRNEVVVTWPVARTVIQGTTEDSTATGSVSILLYNTQGTASRHETMCSGCGGTEADWSVSLDLIPGVYTAYATATDLAGNASPQASVRFYVV